MSAPARELTLFNGASDNSIETQFIGNTAPISGAYADANNFFATLGYLQEPISVRVAKSAIGNTSGGNAYLDSPTGYDVNYLVSSFLGNLETGNFTVTSFQRDAFDAGRNASSATKAGIAGSGVLAQISTANTDETTKIGRFSAYSGVLNNIPTTTITNLADFAGLSQLGDSLAIRTLSTGNLEIENSLALS